MKDFRELLKIEESWEKFRRFKAIKVGKYYLSIQASFSHYCDPRETVDIYNYESMEIAIFDSDNEWVQPREDEYIKNFLRYEELIDGYEDGEVAVRGWIDIDLIQDLCNYLERSIIE